MLRSARFAVAALLAAVALPGAAFAADAYARASGRVGVCMATSGPGATNLVTGIANAMMDSVPMVCITGNVAQGVMGTDAFQEIDILGVTLPIVKHSMLVRDPADVPAAVETAFHIAASGRPGPVLVDLPKDVQVGATTAPRAFSVPNTAAGVDDEAVAAAETAIRAARRPLIYVGGGVKIARATPSRRHQSSWSRIEACPIGTPSRRRWRERGASARAGTPQSRCPRSRSRHRPPAGAVRAGRGISRRPRACR